MSSETLNYIYSIKSVYLYIYLRVTLSVYGIYAYPGDGHWSIYPFLGPAKTTKTFVQLSCDLTVVCQTVTALQLQLQPKYLRCGRREDGRRRKEGSKEGSLRGLVTADSYSEMIGWTQRNASNLASSSSACEPVIKYWWPILGTDQGRSSDESVARVWGCRSEGQRDHHNFIIMRINSSMDRRVDRHDTLMHRNGISVKLPTKQP